MRIGYSAPGTTHDGAAEEAGPSGHVVTCGIFKEETGLGVRRGYADENLLRSSKGEPVRRMPDRGISVAGTIRGDDRSSSSQQSA